MAFVRRRLTPEVVVLGAIVTLAVALRFVAIGTNLAMDDGYSYIVGSAPNVHAFLQRLAASENTPPLFYLLLTPLPLDHAAWLRLPAAIPGILQCLVLYYVLRRALGVRTAQLATLAVAVTPLLITYADVARAFMLEDLALLVALWAVLRLGEHESRRRWAIYLVAGVVAVYSEYDGAIFLLALTAVALWLGAPQRKRMALLGPLPIATLLPWIPEVIRGQNQIDVTKLSPLFASPSLDVLRDTATTLAFGEYGGTTSGSGRWLEFALMVAVAGLVVVVLRRSWATSEASSRRAITLMAAVAALTLLGHLIAGFAGIQIFNARYLTILIPIAAALGAAAIVRVDRRVVTIAATLLLVALGLANLERRYGHEWQPGAAGLLAAANAEHPRTVLTNTPVVVFYLRAFKPLLDRPYNLGPGRANSCARPCLIIDDTRVHGGPARHPDAPRTTIGPYVLWLEP
jgi:uncharacterized membrane protein